MSIGKKQFHRAKREHLGHRLKSSNIIARTSAFSAEVLQGVGCRKVVALSQQLPYHSSCIVSLNHVSVCNQMIKWLSHQLHCSDAPFQRSILLPHLHFRLSVYGLLFFLYKLVSVTFCL